MSLQIGPAFNQAQSALAVVATNLCLNGDSSGTGLDPLSNQDRFYVVHNNGSATNVFFRYQLENEQISCTEATAICCLGPKETTTIGCKRGYKVTMVRSAGSDATSTNINWIVGS